MSSAWQSSDILIDGATGSERRSSLAAVMPWREADGALILETRAPDDLFDPISRKGNRLDGD